MNAETSYIRQLEQAELEQLADEQSAQAIEAALLAGRRIRYGFQRHEILDAEDVKNEFSPDVFRSVAANIAVRDYTEAGRQFAIEQTRAVTEIAKRHAGLRAEYLARLDEQESAADRHSLREV